MRKVTAKVLSGLACCAVALVGPAALGAEMQTEKDQVVLPKVVCGARPTNYGAPMDYRTPGYFESTTESQHTQVALGELLRPNPDPQKVLHNLNFTLMRAPNHHVALDTLARWETGGGTMRGTPGMACYFLWAEQFAPDDAIVMMIAGNYYAKKGEKPVARAWYSKALTVNPESAEVHYNYGLLLFDLQEYGAARRQAEEAYSRGYPLPGLRNKLVRAGKWETDGGSSD